jgi:hypothetical protein
MRWTDFRRLATRTTWFSESLDNDGAATYELAIAGPRGGDLTIVYVGETGEERRRLSAYGRDGSHLAEIIRWHLREGWHLYFRAVSMHSKDAARALQDQLLARFEYEWNRTVGHPHAA